MSKTDKSSLNTRGATEHFLIGHHQSSMDSGGKLPVSRKILQYLKFRQTLPGRQNNPVKSLVCCSLIKNTQTAGCHGTSGCMSGEVGVGDMCVVAALNSIWIKEGIPKISVYISKSYETF